MKIKINANNQEIEQIKLKIKRVFQLLFVALRPTLDYSQGKSLTNPMLITAFVQFQPEVHRTLHNKSLFSTLPPPQQSFKF